MCAHGMSFQENSHESRQDEPRLDGTVSAVIRHWLSTCCHPIAQRRVVQKQTLPLVDALQAMQWNAIAFADD